MLALAIEVLGAVLALVGAVAWHRSARGAARRAAILPVLVYAAGQGVSIFATGREDFAGIYPWALVLMAIGGAWGLVFAIRAPSRTIDDAQE